MLFSPSTAVALVAMVPTVLGAVDPIIAKGSHFFESKSGNQFYIKGIAYQQGIPPSGIIPKGGAPDPLADPQSCQRDVKYLKELETNTVRVYSIDPTQNHDACMKTFADAGIYVVADLSSPDNSIITTDPQWNDDIYNQYISVIDAMQKYDNMLGFFAGNEVVTNQSNTNAAAYIKAAVRDTKAYIKAKKYRNGLGVGYSTNDNPDIRENLAHYLDCGNQDDAVDFMGLNIYEWCSASETFQSSGYANQVSMYKSYNKPVFFSEYGCNTDPPRLFIDTPVLLGPQMDSVFSGGIVFEYFQQTNDYGLVKVSGNSVRKIQPDWDNLSKEIRSANPSSTQMSSYSPTNQPQSCPPIAKDWQAAPALPPVPNAELCSCMVKSLSCVAKSSIDKTDYPNLFSYACAHGGKGACDGITGDAKTGTYGAYSMCNPQEQLSFAFNAYAKHVGGSDSCSFKGNAESQTPSSASGSCKKLLGQAGPKGTGQVHASPTVSGNPKSAKAGSSSSSSVASPMLIPGVSMSILGTFVSVAAAFAAGCSLILL